MTNIKISASDLSSAIENKLRLYNTNVTNRIKDTTKNSMSKLVKLTKANAPRSKNGKKHYFNSITSKKTKESNFDVEYTWYVKDSNYRLSHLIENGHKTRRIKHGKSYTNGYHFISNATDVVETEYVKKVEEILKNGA